MTPQWQWTFEVSYCSRLRYSNIITVLVTDNNKALNKFGWCSWAVSCDESALTVTEDAVTSTNPGNERSGCQTESYHILCSLIDRRIDRNFHSCFYVFGITNLTVADVGRHGLYQFSSMGLSTTYFRSWATLQILETKAQPINFLKLSRIRDITTSGLTASMLTSGFGQFRR